MNDAGQQQRSSQSLLDRLSRARERAEAIRKKLGEDVSYFAGAEPMPSDEKGPRNTLSGNAPTPINGVIREANDRLTSIEDCFVHIEGLLNRLHQV